MSNEDYKAIADRLVERGIGERDQPNLPHSNQVYYYAPDTHPDEPNDDEGFCHDWRVAGACMERMTSFEYQVCRGCIYTTIDGDDYGFQETESLPLAIILAYLESSESENKCGDFDE